MLYIQQHVDFLPQKWIYSTFSEWNLTLSCLCVCPAAGYEGTSRAYGFDGKIRASGEFSLFVFCGCL